MSFTDTDVEMQDDSSSKSIHTVDSKKSKTRIPSHDVIVFIQKLRLSLINEYDAGGSIVCLTLLRHVAMLLSKMKLSVMFPDVDGGFTQASHNPDIPCSQGEDRLSRFEAARAKYQVAVNKIIMRYLSIYTREPKKTITNEDVRLFRLFGDAAAKIKTPDNIINYNFSGHIFGDELADKFGYINDESDYDTE